MIINHVVFGYQAWKFAWHNEYAHGAHEAYLTRRSINFMPQQEKKSVPNLRIIGKPPQTLDGGMKIHKL